MPDRNTEVSRETIDISEDEDVRYLYRSSRNEEPLKCQFCGINLNYNTEQERQEHYEHHFDNEDSIPSGSQIKNITCSFLFSKLNGTQEKAAKKDSIFWHPSLHSLPPSNYTPGLIPILKRSLNTTHSRGFTVRAAFCHERMVHVATEDWDMGWGCGYRNFLMACTALYDQDVQPDYFPLLDSPSSPSVRNLQSWIEDAWKSGFDAEGARQLDHKLKNTKKWIGTGEIYVALSYRGIPARLVDFPLEETGVEALLKWVEAYFTSPYPFEQSSQNHPSGHAQTIGDALWGASPVISTERMPLILQHKGHSRTIVGFEKHSNGSTNLLIMDPSRRPPEGIRQMALQSWKRRNFGDNDKSHEIKNSSATKMAHKILRTPQAIGNKLSSPKKRQVSKSPDRISDSNAGPSKMKKVRGGFHDIKSDIIILDDTDDKRQPRSSAPKQQTGVDGQDRQKMEMDAGKVVEFFRLSPKRLMKNRQYQILYFPLEPPLTDEEKLLRRNITCDVVK